jgi:hypothetical protein
MTASFDDAMLEFETIFEAASHAQSLKARRSLLAQATATLVKAVRIWQDEMKQLRSASERAHAARLRLTESGAQPLELQSASAGHPPCIKVK